MDVEDMGKQRRVHPLADRPATEVAEAEVQPELRVHAVDDLVQEFDEQLGPVGVDRGRGLVELDEFRPGGDQGRAVLGE